MFDLRQLQIKHKRAADIFNAFESAIFTGQLAPGDQLPPLRVLAEQLGVNKNTVAVSYRLLQEGGLIIADGRRGSVVAGTGARRPEMSMTSMDIAGDAIRLHDGNPDLTLLPDERNLRAVLKTVSLAPRLYGEERNCPELVAWSQRAFDKDGIAARSVFVSAGALDAVDRVLKTNLRVGDKVALEDPGYMTTIALCRALGLRPVAMAMDANGIVPESLSEAIRGGCRAIIFSARAQNPTGIVTSAKRARELALIVKKADGVIFIDDDHSGMLELAPHAHWHTAAARWIVIRSFSKCLGPDFRIAVSAGDATTIEKLELSQRLSTGWVSNLVQRIVWGLITDEKVMARVAAAGRAYCERYRALASELVTMGFPVVGSAGFNIWIPLQDGATVAQQLLARGWLVRAGSDFSVSGAGGLRITTARMGSDQLGDFIRALKDMSGRPTATLSA